MTVDGTAPPALPRNIACALSMLAWRLEARERPAVLLWTRVPEDKAVAFEQRGSVLVATLLHWGNQGSNYLFSTKNAVPLRLRVKPDGSGIQEEDFKRLRSLAVEFLDETEGHPGGAVLGLFNAERLEGVLSGRLVRAWFEEMFAYGTDLFAVRRYSPCYSSSSASWSGLLRAAINMALWAP